MIESKLANEDQTMMVSKAGSLYTQLAGPDPPASWYRLKIQANNSSLNLGQISSLGRVSCGGIPVTRVSDVMGGRLETNFLLPPAAAVL